ncbi:hypothetical protein [Lachnoclostridium sp. Marseille-P6806]|uniref:hypothetical protein n=1 Tax=Lachnoclostridium sp. Marseille-P6806 TaxID=2364793 RepID=UPI00103092B7|nr:hypothetical protein [Lachnoclostridium sp. Marseille-P6806]
MKAEYFLTRKGEKIGAIYDTRQRVSLPQLEQDALAGRLENVTASRSTDGVRLVGNGVPSIEDREPEPSTTGDINFYRLWREF